MNVYDQLREARDLVSRGWCQGENVMFDGGKPVLGHPAKATRFCAAGAILHVAGYWGDDFVFPESVYSGAALRAALEAELRRRGVRESLIEWNDGESVTQEDVLGLFDAAIERGRPDNG